MTSRFSPLVLSALIAVPLPAFGQADGAKLQVEGAWARRAAMMKGDSASGGGSGNGAVYALLVNTGNAPDALVGVASDASATAEIHETYRDMGMMMMRPVKKIGVAAGKKVELKPGGYHIMLLNLKRDLKAGETIGVTLQFEKAGKIAATATVK
jgi:hypothetical protein